MASTIIAGIIAISAQMIFKPAISNFLGWVLITFKKPFRLFDFILTGNYEGVVMSKNFSGITLKQTDDSIVVLPNALVTSNPVVNKSVTNHRPVSTLFTLSNGLSRADALGIIAKIHNAMMDMPAFVKPVVKVRRISEAGIEIKAKAYCTDKRYTFCKNQLLVYVNEVIPADAWPPIDINVHTVK